MKTNLDSAKLILTNELVDAPHTKNDLYGSANSSMKLENYLIESVKVGINRGDCLDWLVDLMRGNNVADEAIKITRRYAELQYSVLERFVQPSLSKQSK